MNKILRHYASAMPLFFANEHEAELTFFFANEFYFNLNRMSKTNILNVNFTSVLCLRTNTVYKYQTSNLNLIPFNYDTDKE